MIPLTNDVGRWLKHVSGEEKLHQKFVPLQEAVELDSTGIQVISTYGQCEFDAAVGFVDMRGFSTAVTDKSPREIRDFVLPFLSAVIDAAVKNSCLIDKTIGDEAMLIFPSFGRDVSLSGLDLPAQNEALELRPFGFMAELLSNLDRARNAFSFTAGFSIGRVILDRVGCGGYSEWTCYGNCVNAAKRFQSEASTLGRDYPQQSFFAFGGITRDNDDLYKRLSHAANLVNSLRLFHLTLTKVSIEASKPLKGVGETAFLCACVSRKEPE